MKRSLHEKGVRRTFTGRQNRPPISSRSSTAARPGLPIAAVLGDEGVVRGRAAIRIGWSGRWFTGCSSVSAWIPRRPSIARRHHACCDPKRLMVRGWTTRWTPIRRLPGVQTSARSISRATACTKCRSRCAWKKGSSEGRSIVSCAPRPDRMTLLEFKTGRPRSEHQTQLDLYRRAAERIFPDAVIDARLVYADEAAT